MLELIFPTFYIEVIYFELCYKTYIFSHLRVFSASASFTGQFDAFKTKKLINPLKSIRLMYRNINAQPSEDFLFEQPFREIYEKLFRLLTSEESNCLWRRKIWRRRKKKSKVDNRSLKTREGFRAMSETEVSKYEDFFFFSLYRNCDRNISNIFNCDLCGTNKLRQAIKVIPSC